MPNTNTTYFLSEPADSVSALTRTTADSFEICPITRHPLPAVPLGKNEHLIENLIFTIVFLMIFAFVRLRGKDLFYNLFNTLIKRKKADILLNEGISSNLVCYILSLCLSFSALAIGLSFLVRQNFSPVDSFYIFAGLLSYHFFLLLLVRIFGWTFNAKSTADEIIVNIWTFHILIGLLISPLVISVFFVKNYAVVPLLKIVIFSLILFLFVKILRWIEILFAHRVLILYMILYLCALEIVPLLVLYKLVV